MLNNTRTCTSENESFYSHAVHAPPEFPLIFFGQGAEKDGLLRMYINVQGSN